MQAWGGVAGKRVLMTGATRGIGLAAAVELARRGALLKLVARNEARAAHAVRQIQAVATDASVDVLAADLVPQASVRQLAIEVKAKYSGIQVLINNPGAVYARRLLSPDGREFTWAVPSDDTATRSR